MELDAAQRLQSEYLAGKHNLPQMNIHTVEGNSVRGRALEIADHENLSARSRSLNGIGEGGMFPLGELSCMLNSETCF